MSWSTALWNNKTHLLLSHASGQPWDLLLEEFDGIAHAGWEGPTLIQEAAKESYSQPSLREPSPSVVTPAFPKGKSKSCNSLSPDIGLQLVHQVPRELFIGRGGIVCNDLRGRKKLPLGTLLKPQATPQSAPPITHTCLKTRKRAMQRALEPLMMPWEYCRPRRTTAGWIAEAGMLGVGGN